MQAGSGFATLLRLNGYAKAIINRGYYTMFLKQSVESQRMIIAIKQPLPVYESLLVNNNAFINENICSLYRLRHIKRYHWAMVRVL